MKTKSNLLHAHVWSGVLGLLCVVFPGMGDERVTLPAPDGPPAKPGEAIPWTQLGVKAGANYQGDGLAITATLEGARLRCAFQRLDGEATHNGLWLTSTVPGQPTDRFRVMAVAVGREGRAGSPLPAAGGVSVPASRLVSSLAPPMESGAHGVTRPTKLPATGEISSDGQTVRFIRPGLVEEYSVNMDGVRQDFVVLERPPLTLSLPRNSVGTRSTRVPDFSEQDGDAVERVPTEFERRLTERVDDRLGEGELRLELAVTGARVAQFADGVYPVRVAGQGVDQERGNSFSHGARLLLEESGRKIAYSRLRVTDATGKELKARMEVMGSARVPRAGSGVAPEPSSNPDCVERSFRRDAKNHTPEACAPHLAVVVDDAQAVYPIRIDPTFSDANWISMNPSIPGADFTVRAAVVDGSGNLYIGGEFTVVGDVVANHIAKWNGSHWSALGAGVGGTFSPVVYALAVSGSDLYVGGKFTTAGGGAATNIAKWNGSDWSALGSGMNSYGYVYALAVSGNDLYAGGEFTTAGEVSSSCIAKWNGNSWSALGSGIGRADVSSPAVYALAMLGSDLCAGGRFRTAGGLLATNIAKWNGSSWSALAAGIGEVRALAVWGNDLYAGGNSIARWNGSTWNMLGSGVERSDGYAPSVYALAVSNGDVYVGGYFTLAGGNPANYIAKWNGSNWSTLGSGMIYSVYALAASGNDLYAGGSFSMAGGSPAKSIARWDGSNWSALGTGINAAVYALAVLGSDVFVGGSFSMAGAVSANRIAKWNGNGWSALGSGMNGVVRALAVSGSELYVGGGFTTVGGGAATNIVKWSGSNWSALGLGINGVVLALAVTDNNLYAGGDFTTAGGVPATNIAKWNGVSWSALGSGMAGGDGFNRPAVYALAVSGSDLYAGGWFTNAGGVSATNIAKWNGSNWTPLSSGMEIHGSVYALAVSDGDLYAGGRFTTVGGMPANNIAKWNGTFWSALGSGINDYVWALAVSGSDLYAGGWFTTAGGIPANYIAKWNGSSWSPLGSGMSGAPSGIPFAYVNALAASGSDLYAGGGFTTAGGKVSAYIARAVLGDASGYNQLTGTPLSGGDMKFSYIGYPATNYALDRTFDLSQPISWVGQQTNTMSVSGVLTFTNTPAAGTNNFWRVRSVP